MKKILFTSLLCLVACLCTYAKIWRVNNRNGVVADFTTIQAAHDGANSGDTLHVEGSPTAYAGLSSTKKLIIIGPGYFLDQNPGLQAFTLTANIQGITYSVGSEGSIVMGIDFLGNNVSVFCNDIVIKRNKFTSPNGDDQNYASGFIYLYYASNNGNIPVNNIIITQNYGVMINIQNPSTGVLITNNFLKTADFYAEDSPLINSHPDAVVLIQNNIFRRGKVKVNNSSITNNIMFAGTLEGTGNLVSNNVGSGTQFGTANGNKANIDMSTVFVGTGSTDAFWKLKAGSPALGAGFGSTAQNPIDAGMYGGQTPYVLSGLPPVPSVYFFENQPVGSSSDPIDVTLKVKANN